MNKIILIFTILFLITTVHATMNTFDEIQNGIIERSAGLVFISEDDSDVVLFYRTRTVETLSESEFKRVARIPQLATIETVSFDQFFTRLINADETGRWESLREYLENNLQDCKVFRVPRPDPFDNTFDVYAVGLFENKVIGIHVVSLET